MKARWVILGAILAVAAFAVVVGGLLWPRPQFTRGPWTRPDSTAVGSDSTLEATPTDSTEP